MKRKQTTAYAMYYREHIVLVTLTSVLLLLFAAYVYFVSASIVHVVIRQEIQQEITAVSSEISDLETHYIALQHSVSKDIATQNGFVAASDKIYIDRSPTNLVLSNRFEDGS